MFFLLVDTDFLGVFIRDFFVFIAEHLEFSETFYPFLLIFTFLPVSYILQEKTGRGSEYTAVFSPLIDVDIFDK